MTSASIVSKLADLAEAASIGFGQISLAGLTDTLLKQRFPISDASTAWPETKTPSKTPGPGLLLMYRPVACQGTGLISQCHDSTAKSLFFQA